MRRFNKFWVVLLIVFGLNSITLGQGTDQAVPLGTSQNMLKKLQTTTQNNNARVVSEVELAITSTKSLKGKINFKKSTSNEELLVGEISGVKDASFFIKASDESLEGHIILKATKKAYKYYSDASGNAFVEEVDINKLICIDYENKPTKQQQKIAEAQSKEAAVISPALLDLQSLPGAAGCVMLDFDGYYMAAGNYWNNGNAINAAPSGMSDDAVREHWEIVSEDYRPFNVNITTNEAVFNSYPRNRRMRCVITPTNTAAPGAGGVAYIGSFNWDNDVPCWEFMTSGKAGGEASSHEIGHTFDLGHDGRTNQDEYFVGIDGTAWAPIMGAGYYRPVTQWSRGEYNNANNLQDDVATIAGAKFGIGYRGDDYSNSIAGAANLDYNSSGAINQKYGIISSEADYDFFTFTTGGGNVVINANTVGRHGNLHILMRLYNEAGAQIGTYWNSDPFALNATMNVNLAAGKYYVGVDGNGAGDKGYGGYSAYASIGSYWVSGNIPPANSVNPSTGIVTTYKDINYTGFSGGFSVGDYNLAALRALGVEDNSITSVKVSEGYKIILYFDDNFTGQSMTITSDNNYVGGTFNDQVTSLRVRPNGTPISGTYYLQNRMSGLYMDVWGLSTADGAAINQGGFNGGTNQQFEFTHLGDGNHSIKAKHSGKVIDVAGISKSAGANIHQWTNVNGANQHMILVSTGDGYYKVIPEHSGLVVEISTNTNGEQLHQWWNAGQLNSHWKLVPVTVANGNGDGLTGNYFNGMNFENPVYSRKDATINFAWGNGSPNAAVNADGFSARWTGQVQPKYSGEYTFFVNSDNGRRLWINGQLIIDAWIDNWNVDYSGKITLAAGQKYDIKLEYFENYGGAGAKLEWAHASQQREVVPQTQLYSNALPSVSITSPANNANFNAAANITINANASDNVSVAKVEFYNGATKIGEDASSPYSIAWNNVTEGTYTLTTRATDNQGGITVSSSITVKVNQGTTPVNQVPTVSLTSPANNATYNAPASINISANASDADGNVTKVEFYNGGTKLGEDASAPYTYTWTGVAAGTYTISAKAFDNNNASTNSGSVTVKVNPVVVNDPCSNLATYSENNGYVAGSKVKNAGKQFECKEWPYSGWCNGASWAYAPGTGAYWQDAWYERGTCNARTGNNNDLTSSNSNVEINIAPNPAENSLSISSDLDLSNVHVTIADITGRVLIDNNNSSTTIDISNLNAGVYTITFVTNENNKSTKRFIKK